MFNQIARNKVNSVDCARIWVSLFLKDAISDSLRQILSSRVFAHFLSLNLILTIKVNKLWNLPVTDAPLQNHRENPCNWCPVETSMLLNYGCSFYLRSKLFYPHINGRYWIKWANNKELPHFLNVFCVIGVFFFFLHSTWFFLK